MQKNIEDETDHRRALGIDRTGHEEDRRGGERLEEEMGFTIPLKETISFIYKAPFDNGLTEHELDHIMVGNFNGSPKINETEVVSWKWMSLEEVKEDIANRPDQYTAWFKIIFDKFYQHISQ